MTRPQCPADELELAALLDGELTENRAPQLREHLAGCPSCAARMDRLAALAAQLRAPVPEALDADFVDAVERRLPAAGVPPQAAHPHRRRLFFTLSTLAAAAAAITLVILPRGRVTSDFTARGADSPWHARVSTSLEVVTSGPRATTRARPIAAGDRLRPGDGIAVNARNGNADLPVYLMVFAVDARDEVHWIVPAWSDPADNPRSVRLPPGGALPGPTGRTPEAPASGKLRLLSLLSRAPVDVRSVEALLQAHRPLAAGGDRHLRTLEVEMAGPDDRSPP